MGFQVLDTAVLAKAFGIGHINGPGYAVIWTTTPWTLPANQAVCVHPELTYDLIETSKGLLILVHELVESALARYSEGDTTTLASCKGALLST